MSVRVVLGAQWGDEGKGKIVDLLSNRAKWVVRYQGGANAGHTIVFDGKKIVLHLIPSGVFNGNARCVIGSGVVFDPSAFLIELEQVKEHVDDLEGRLFLAQNAHVITPYHKLLDEANELRRNKKIGTTGRGIGPAYNHKTARVGIRVSDLIQPKVLEEKVRANVENVNRLFRCEGLDLKADADEIIAELKRAASLIQPFISPVTALLHDALDRNEPILLEGAQGCLLDLDHGTYPFVTSSSPTSGGACTGSGIPPTAIDNVMGIVKAYCTRVGNGPFPTELHDETGEKLRQNGNEFGATTGRPRRCGWLDLVALRYAVRINGINELSITKIDVLNDFEQINVCTEYRLDGDKTRDFVPENERLERTETVYKSFPGWNQDISGVTQYEQLPEKLLNYLRFIEDYLGVEVNILSNGPDRTETLIRKLED